MGKTSNSQLLKLQHLRNVLHTIGNLTGQTLTRDLNMAFKIPYLTRFHYITVKGAGNSYTKSWKFRYSHLWSRRGST